MHGGVLHVLGSRVRAVVSQYEVQRNTGKGQCEEQLCDSDNRLYLQCLFV